ncbi:MAG: iron-containing redox enzyme family protein [Candidatus Binatia bacterium]
MTEQEWRDGMGELVRESAQSEANKQYDGIKLTKARAQIYITQQSLFIRHRRDCWAYVSGNCPQLSVKQKILEHEYEEIIRDEYSEYGHLDLVIRQAKSIGLSPEEVIDTLPLPTTRAALYAYGWLTRKKPWQEGLAALMATERMNDNQLLADLGGGSALRTGKKWIEDLGLTWEQIPNAAAHSKADEKHSEMFLSCLAEFVPCDQEEIVLQATRESLELRELMLWGIGEAMEKVS